MSRYCTRVRTRIKRVVFRTEFPHLWRDICHLPRLVMDKTRKLLSLLADSWNVPKGSKHSRLVCDQLKYLAPHELSRFMGLQILHECPAMCHYLWKGRPMKHRCSVQPYYHHASCMGLRLLLLSSVVCSLLSVALVWISASIEIFSASL